MVCLSHSYQFKVHRKTLISIKYIIYSVLYSFGFGHLAISHFSTVSLIWQWYQTEHNKAIRALVMIKIMIQFSLSHKWPVSENSSCCSVAFDLCEIIITNWKILWGSWKTWRPVMWTYSTFSVQWQTTVMGK